VGRPHPADGSFTYPNPMPRIVYCIRPVTPRGLRSADLVLFSRGDRSTKGFTDFHTRIHLLAGAAPPV
jgi:hypothetical protein